MQAHPQLDLEREGPVARVFLNRPAVHNAFNEDLIDEVHGAFTALDADSSVRVIILGGRGPSFCAGADLTWMRSTARYTEAENEADALRLAGLFKVIHDCRKPVIGRIHGAAIGGGTGLVASCDIPMATLQARFAFSEVRLGLAPAVISPFVIARIGVAAARELFITGERIDAARALEIGLVSHVFEGEAAMDEAIARTVARILKSPPGAVSACKRIATTVPLMAAEEVTAETAKVIAGLRAAPEGQEGMTAFLEGRRPSWTAEGEEP